MSTHCIEFSEVGTENKKLENLALKLKFVLSPRFDLSLILEIQKSFKIV